MGQRLRPGDVGYSAALRKPGRPTQDLAELIGHNILDVALIQFGQNGVDAVRMDEIAAAAGVTKRTLYARYGSKEGLLIAAIERDNSPRIDAMLEAVPEGSPRSRLLHMAQTLLEIALTPEAVSSSRLIQHLSLAKPHLISEKVLHSHNRYREMFRRLVAECMTETEDREHIDFTSAALFDLLVVGPRFQILRWGELENSREERARYLERALDMATFGVLAPELEEALLVRESIGASSPEKKVKS